MFNVIIKRYNCNFKNSKTKQNTRDRKKGKHVNCKLIKRCANQFKLRIQNIEYKRYECSYHEHSILTLREGDPTAIGDHHCHDTLLQINFNFNMKR